MEFQSTHRSLAKQHPILFGGSLGTLIGFLLSVSVAVVWYVQDPREELPESELVGYVALIFAFVLMGFLVGIVLGYLESSRTSRQPVMKDTLTVLKETVVDRVTLGGFGIYMVVMVFGMSAAVLLPGTVGRLFGSLTSCVAIAAMLLYGTSKNKKK